MLAHLPLWLIVSGVMFVSGIFPVCLAIAVSSHDRKARIGERP